MNRVQPIDELAKTLRNGSYFRSPAEQGETKVANEIRINEHTWALQRMKIGFSGGSKPREDKHSDWLQDFSRKECVLFLPAKRQSEQDMCHCGAPEQEHETRPKFLSTNKRNETDCKKRAKEWNEAYAIHEFPTDAGGKILWTGEENSNGATFVRLSDSSPMEAVLYMLRRDSELPNLLVSILSDNRGLLLNGRRKRIFASGLCRTASATRAWVVTNGCHTGASRLTAEILKERKAMQSDYRSLCIGVTPWGAVDGRYQLKTLGGIVRYKPSGKNTKSCQPTLSLNPDHTHFLLVDDGYRYRFHGAESFRSRLEKEMVTLAVPVVSLLLGGDLQTLSGLQEQLENGTPLVVLIGSGRLANVLGFICPRLHWQPESGLWALRSSQICKLERLVMDSFQDEISGVEGGTDIVGKLMECCQHRKLITIFDLWSEIDLDHCILSAVLRGDDATKYTQLQLAMRWGRSDIAEQKILSGESSWPLGSLETLFTEALLDEKVEFVQLLLQNGVYLQDYLTINRLQQLYQATADQCPELHMLCLPGGIVTLQTVHRLLSILCHNHTDPLYDNKNAEKGAQTLGLKLNVFGLLDICFEKDRESALNVAERPHEKWSSRSILQLASVGRILRVMACSTCQECVAVSWMRGMKTMRWWLLIMVWLCPVLLWTRIVKFLPLSDDQGPPGCIQRLATFYHAPAVKFLSTALAHFVLVTCHTYLVLLGFRWELGIVETTVWIWMLALFIDEIREVACQPSPLVKEKIYEHMRNVWNQLDTAIFILSGTAAVLRCFRSAFQTARVLLALNTTVLYIRFFRFYHAHYDLGPKLNILYRMIREVLVWLNLLVIFTLSYGVASQALLRPDRELSWTVIEDVFFLPYWQMYGELLLEEIAGEEKKVCNEGDTFCEDLHAYHWLSPVLLAVYLLIGNVLLLNLLIAIFSYVFQKVQEHSVEIWKYEMYRLVEEYDSKPCLPAPLLLAEDVMLFVCWVWHRICRCGSRAALQQPPGFQSLDAFEKECMALEVAEAESKKSGDVDQRLKQIESRLEEICKFLDLSEDSEIWDNELVAENEPASNKTSSDDKMDSSLLENKTDVVDKSPPPVAKLLQQTVKLQMNSIVEKLQDISEYSQRQQSQIEELMKIIQSKN